MNGWTVGGLAFAGFIIWVVIANMRERRRQRELAATRSPLTDVEFVGLLADSGIEELLATFLWDELKPYYFAPLSPHPSDRIYGGMKIDPDDISDIALRYERHFGVWLGEVPIDCVADPTIAELGLALQRAGC